MTVKNNSLSDKLNEFKNKNQKLLEDELAGVKQKNPLADFLNSGLIFFTFILKSIIFGYSSKIVFGTDWNFLSILCIGISISLILSYMHQLIHNNKLIQ